MELCINHFYFILDKFYNDFPDQNLMINKGENHCRPCFFSFKDNNGLFWMIPISSKIKKYKKIYKHKTMNGNKCDTLYFAKVLGKEKVFLLQNMFPIIKEYIANEYLMKNGLPVEIPNKDSEVIIKKCKKLIALLHHGKKELIFPDVQLIVNKLTNASK